MTLREQLFEAILGRITNLPGLPPPVRSEDDPRAEDYVPITPGILDPAHFLSLLDEGVARRPDCPPVMGAGGVIYDWDLNLVAGYIVRATDKTLREPQRDTVTAQLSAAILPPTADISELKLGGLANWMWVGAPDIVRNMYDADVLLAAVRLPIKIWFSANDPAA